MDRNGPCMSQGSIILWIRIIYVSIPWYQYITRNCIPLHNLYSYLFIEEAQPSPRGWGGVLLNCILLYPECIVMYPKCIPSYAAGYVGIRRDTLGYNQRQMYPRTPIGYTRIHVGYT